jgi:hypothetical protein
LSRAESIPPKKSGGGGGGGRAPFLLFIRSYSTHFAHECLFFSYFSWSLCVSQLSSYYYAHMAKVNKENKTKTNSTTPFFWLVLLSVSL